MIGRKFLNIILAVIMLSSVLLGSTSQVTAAPTSPTDETKVPHYFGPWPNWANSPLTLPDATVTITGDGSGAEAVATVGADGAITAITVTNPGSGYSNAKVDITGSGTGATADATIVKKGSVVAVTVDQPGSGYTAPTVSFSDGTAAATAYGGVDAVTLVAPNFGGNGYTFPTVDFDLPDGPGGVQAKGHAVCIEVNCAPPTEGATVTVTGVVVDSPGSGYSTAPKVVIRDGTIFDPIKHDPGTFTAATATATLSIQSIVLDAFGDNYKQAPTVTINDPTGFGALATAVIDNGIISAITIKKPGSGYITQGGIKKFQDGLPMLCLPAAGQTFADCTDNNLGQHLPIAVPDQTTFSTANGFDLDADYYVIALVQTREQMNSSLPAEGTLLREYVQLETPANFSFSKHVALQTANLDGTYTPTLMPDGSQAIAVDDPHFLGPVIVAQKDRPVRITFYNLLPTGQGGDLFLPTDSTIMGSGPGPDAPAALMDPLDEGSVLDAVRNPVCTDTFPKSNDCFKDNRATLHLHGGITPWISDGTPHQWITPAGENPSYPQGVSVEAVPDMIGQAAIDAGIPDCSDPLDGCMSFYYTNQQSARFMFYHDHAWGITRLNVYAGEAAGYVITDDTDQKLMAPGGPLADVGLGIPLVIQDRTFVPSDAQLYNQYDANNNVISYGQDPTWDESRWGGYGNFWYHHVYMPAQNPGDPSGMSAFGRWMYGPWFWPPATPQHGPIDNPYYDPNCNLDDPATWTYQEDPFCEPPLIPGTPNISAGMEQFNDTPIVNGTAYPTTTVDPKAYRFRILNAANDRFWNLQWYVADSTGTEVALNPAELAAAQIDPNIFPTPDTSVSPPGPSWIQIGSEGGFLPAPVVVPNQPITWIIDPTRFDVGNVDKHSLLLAPAERADVIVDFSKYAGQTLILYNDAPAAFPARVSSYDYYTGGPDLSPAGAPTTIPGYGPNTRTIMQVKVAATAPAPAYNLTALQAAFRHKADGSGVFESGQHPIIVGQAAYNSAYGTNFASSGWCNSPTKPSAKCDGFARISEQGGDLFKFDTLMGQQVSIPLEPKAIHDEMNSANFDEFGRMTANLGLEAVPATPALQNVTLYPYVNPQTELIDATNLPKNDISMTPISPISSADGTQIWKITHNGVDTHPIHWHLYDVQVLNRVTWDNIIIPPDASELGWKDTLRISPLEDTIVALRPIIPYLPFDLPNSVRPMNPWTPLGSPMGFNNIDANGNPTAPITNALVNFGWEYVFHCHILSHEEMDMMRPVSVAMPPNTPDGLVFTAGELTWMDNSINETAFVVQRNDGTGWVDLATIDQPLHQPDPATGKGQRSYTDTTFDANLAYQYRVVALNVVGYTGAGGAFMSLTVQSVSDPMVYDNSTLPAAPILTAAYQAGPPMQIVLNWSDTAAETSYTVERSTDNGTTWNQIADLLANVTTFTDTLVDIDSQYSYRVNSININGSTPSNVATVTTPPNAPTNLTADSQAGPQILLNWTDNATFEDGFVIERIEGDITTLVTTVGPDVQTYTDTTVAFDGAYSYQVYAFNASGSSVLSNLAAVNAPPLAPTGLTALYQSGVQLTWFDQSLAETGFDVQRCEGAGCTNFATIATVGPLISGNGVGNVTYLDENVVANGIYSYQVFAVNASGPSDASNIVSITLPNFPAAPTPLTIASAGTTGSNARKITVTWTSVPNANGYSIEWATDSAFTTQVGSGSANQNATSFTTPNNALTRGTTYYFRIRANTAADGSSLWAYYPDYTLP
jgi:FtsP/CotA-like multicopper oxidase with cupredoxin domain